MMTPEEVEAFVLSLGPEDASIDAVEALLWEQAVPVPVREPVLETKAETTLFELMRAETEALIRAEAF